MIYLDNSATTRPFDSVIDAMDQTACANIISMRRQRISLPWMPTVRYAPAVRAIASQLGTQESGIIFTGGGTESDNLAILGVAATLRHPREFCLQRHRASGRCGDDTPG